MKSGNLNFLEPSGPLQACNGTALPLPFNLKVSGQTHAVAALPPGKKYRLKVFEKRKISFLCCVSSPGWCCLQHSHYTDWAIAIPRVHTTHTCYCPHSVTFQVMYPSLAMVLTKGTTHYDIRSMSDNSKHETSITYKTPKIRVGVQAASYRLPVQEALFHNYGSTGVLISP